MLARRYGLRSRRSYLGMGRVAVRHGLSVMHCSSLSEAAELVLAIQRSAPPAPAPAASPIQEALLGSVLGAHAEAVALLGGHTLARGLAAARKRLASAMCRDLRSLDAAASLLRHPAKAQETVQRLRAALAAGAASSGSSVGGAPSADDSGLSSDGLAEATPEQLLHPGADDAAGRQSTLDEFGIVPAVSGPLLVEPAAVAEGSMGAAASVSSFWLGDVSECATQTDTSELVDIGVQTNFDVADNATTAFVAVASTTCSTTGSCAAEAVGGPAAAVTPAWRTNHLAEGGAAAAALPSAGCARGEATQDEDVCDVDAASASPTCTPPPASSSAVAAARADSADEASVTAADRIREAIDKRGYDLEVHREVTEYLVSGLLRKVMPAVEAASDAAANLPTGRKQRRVAIQAARKAATDSVRRADELMPTLDSSQVELAQLALDRVVEDTATATDLVRTVALASARELLAEAVIEMTRSPS